MPDPTLIQLKSNFNSDWFVSKRILKKYTLSIYSLFSLCVYEQQRSANELQFRLAGKQEKTRIWKDQRSELKAGERAQNQGMVAGWT